MNVQGSTVKLRRESADESRQPLIKGFRVHRVGLEIDKGVNQRTWYEFGKLIQHADYARDWIIADWLAYGEHSYGSKIYELASRIFGKAPRTWEDYAYIARNVKVPVRSETLTTLVHKPVAPFSDDPDLQRELIGIAEQHGLSKVTFEAVIELYLEGKRYSHLLSAELTPVERARLRGVKQRERALKQFLKEGDKAWVEYVREQADGWRQLLREIEKTERKAKPRASAKKRRARPLN